MENKHKAVIEYLNNYPNKLLNLYFNSSSEELNNISLNTIVSESWGQKYIRGAIANYDFAIAIMKPYDTGTSNINADEMFDVQKFMYWIEEQNKNKNFPIFEDGKVLSIQNLQNTPNLAGINETGDLAKYMFQIRIEYYKGDN